MNGMINFRYPNLNGLSKQQQNSISEVFSAFHSAKLAFQTFVKGDKTNKQIQQKRETFCLTNCSGEEIKRGPPLRIAKERGREKGGQKIKNDYTGGQRVRSVYVTACWGRERERMRI